MSKPGALVVSHAEQQTQPTAAGAGQSASANDELTAQSDMLHAAGRLTALAGGEPPRSRRAPGAAARPPRPVVRVPCVGEAGRWRASCGRRNWHNVLA
jgi:hypothetical protein